MVFNSAAFLIFFILFFPAYGSQRQKPSEYEIYRRFGSVLIPPAEILENKDYWFDDSHLNQAGGESLSLWLAKELNDLL
jgi:hypothetical protein